MKIIKYQSDIISIMVLQLIRAQIQQEVEKYRLDLEKLRGSKVLLLYADIDRAIVDWANQVATTLNKEGRPEKLDVIIHSGGGDIDAAYHIFKILNEVPTKELNFVVPRFAKSAATLLACGGNQIIMSDMAELGPLDPQIKRDDGSSISALSVKAALNLLKDEFKKENVETATILTHKLDALDLGEIERTLGISRKYLDEVLKKRMLCKKKGRKVNSIVESLTVGYTHHSYLID